MNFVLAISLIASLMFATPDPRAAAAVDRAIGRMGGAELLRGVQRVRYDMVTQWLRVNFDDRPFSDMPSFEQHADVRDYSIPAWRNSRRSGTFEFIDVVRDTVGARFMRGAWTALNTAYLDERREVFFYTPDRLMLAADASPDLVLLPDTLIGGLAHTRVRGTMAGFPATLFLRKSDDLPAMLRFRAAQPNDFGLTEWGNMDVEVWYSRWTTLQNGLSVPMQWDIKRVGRAYKRLTVNAMTVNPALEADSFVVADSVRDLFLRTQRRPMHDLPFDSAKIVEERVAVFNTFGAPSGAVRLGNSWLLLEAGQAPLSAERAVNWLESKSNQKVGAAVLTHVVATNGGIVWLTQRKIPVTVAPGAATAAGIILRNHGAPAAGYTTMKQGQWLKLSGDSAWIEPIDLPNARGTALVYVPSLKLLYSGSLGTPLDINLLLERAQQRGWQVERLGSPRGLSLPIPK